MAYCNAKISSPVDEIGEQLSTKLETKNTRRSHITRLRDAVLGIDVLRVSGNVDHYNGFFIRDYRIIAPSSVLTQDYSKIIVTISNVNNVAYVYEVEPIGVDMIGGVAILTINKSEWNLANPEISREHPWLPWGKSRNIPPGNSVTIIGDVLVNGRAITENTIHLATIGDNRYVSWDKNIPGELLYLTGITETLSSGAPVISEYGEVIGITIADKNLCLAEFFIRRAIKALLRVYVDESIPERYQQFVTYNGKYYVYNKSYVGLKGVLLRPSDYLTNSSLLTAKGVVGYKIISSEIKEIEPGDIVTHINKCELGDRKGQIHPAIVMWRVRPETDVEIFYKKQSDKYVISRQLIVKTKAHSEHEDSTILI